MTGRSRRRVKKEMKQEKRMGKLYGLGVGPGDPELLTLKAYRILNEADVIFCPEKETGAGSAALDIIRCHLEHARADIVYLAYPMNYHGAQLRTMWEANAVHIAGCLEGDRTGAFITLGDPSVYSTFMYTLPYIEAAGVAVESVPGVTSFCAAANQMKLPLAAWDQDLVVAPVRRKGSGDLGKILAEHDNVVLMKPSSDRQALIEAIRRNHLEDKFALVAKSGTQEERRITDFAELEQYDIPYLSTIIIKKQGTQEH